MTFTNESWAVYDSYEDQPEERDKGRSRIIQVVRTDDLNFIICDVAELFQPFTQEEADRHLVVARIIAAAPKMLEALLYHQELSANEGNVWVIDHIRILDEKVDQAIDLATGKQVA